MPEGDYVLPLSQARIVAAGTDITLVAWGQQVSVLQKAVRRKSAPQLSSSLDQRLMPRSLSCRRATALYRPLYRDHGPSVYSASAPLQAEEVAEADGISCEIIDLRTLLPWDVDTVGEH